MSEPVSEISTGEKTGGTNTSHTIGVAALTSLLDELPRGASAESYESAIVEWNVLSKGTEASRRRTYRYLRELYLLRPDSILFRTLRDLWDHAPSDRPLLAGLCALARAPVFRASSGAITSSKAGHSLTSANFAEAVRDRYPDNYKPTTLAKVGRNTFSSWEQTGHLKRAKAPAKTRVRVDAGPAAVSYALCIGHLQGFQGRALFQTIWTEVLDAPPAELLDIATTASRHGLIDVRQAGGVLEIGFTELLRPLALSVSNTDQ